MKKNYANAIVTNKNVEVTDEQIEKIAALGSIVVIKGTKLWHETQNENGS